MLIKQGHEVQIASDGIALKLLKTELPGLTFHTLSKTTFTYPFSNVFLNGVANFFQIFNHLWKDHKQAKNISQKIKANVIISDNRFIFRSKHITKNIYISHQLTIHHDINWISKSLTFVHRLFINHFDSCWVPDTPDHRLSGKLSSNNRIKNIFYIGPLSRIKPEAVVQKDIDVLFLLSGPEPQRTILEQSLNDLFPNLSKYKTCLVRGTLIPSNFAHDSLQNIVLNLADSVSLNNILSRSKLVVCRPGYSTLMDLEPFDVKAIVIPTPGQTEQIYLGKHIVKTNNNYHCILQHQMQDLLPLILTKLN